MCGCAQHRHPLPGGQSAAYFWCHGPTPEPCSSGGWTWSEPHPRSRPSCSCSCRARSLHPLAHCSSFADQSVSTIFNYYYLHTLQWAVWCCFDGCMEWFKLFDAWKSWVPFNLERILQSWRTFKIRVCCFMKHINLVCFSINFWYLSWFLVFCSFHSTRELCYRLGNTESEI